jgi:hypothetical protein
VAVAAAADIVEMLHSPGLRRFAVECAFLGGARAAVDHLVVGDHHQFLGRGDAGDADCVQLLLDAHHHAVVNHYEVRIGIDDIARPDGLEAALLREHFFNCGHSHGDFLRVVSCGFSAVRE